MTVVSCQTVNLVPSTKQGEIMITQENIDNWFSYHSPKEGQPEKYQAIRNQAKIMAETIIKNTPQSADQTVAIRKLRECVMVANASIACEE